MADTTKIQWTDKTFNPWIGCSKVADGCKNCYAEHQMDTRFGRVKWGPGGTRAKTTTWNDPLKWQREAANGICPDCKGKSFVHQKDKAAMPCLRCRQTGKVDPYRSKVFCASLADVFEDWRGRIKDHHGNVLWWTPEGVRNAGATTPGLVRGERPATMDDLRADLFHLIDRTPNLYWLLLTKRPENITTFWDSGPMYAERRENVWLGTSAATQPDADRNIPLLYKARTLSPTLFISLEPQIEFVDLRGHLNAGMLDWVIVGGESRQGGEPRPFHLEWAIDLADQCAEFDVPCFIKQVGAAPHYRKQPMSLKDAHGGNMSEWPQVMRVRECPEYYKPSGQLIEIGG